MKSKPLGKGLQALFEETPLSGYIDRGKNLLEIPLENIKLNPMQPREKMDMTQFTELKESIKQKGLIQPIAVRSVGDSYEVVAGQRRLAAVKELKFKSIPAYVIEAANDKVLLEISLMENIRRVDLNPIEIAKGYKKLHHDFKMTQDDISKVFSIDRSSVANIMRLLKLPKEVQQNVIDGGLSMGHARALLSLPSATEQKKLAKKIIADSLSVREIEKLLKSAKTLKEPSKKTAVKKSTAIQQVEDRLRHTLGSQVRVKQSKNGGKIEIDFYSPEDLERLLELFAVIEKKY